ncbi:MAG: alkaline phosphatase [Solirubrobacteraceae bacterium]
MTANLSRRDLVTRGGAGALALALGTGALPTERSYARPRIDGDVYGLGVASGDPTPDGVVLWTRLAPKPIEPDGLGGMPPGRVAVRWQVAEDPRFRRVVRRGRVTASPELAFAVHPEVHGLRPGREYYYRFEAAGQISPVGRTRTAPAHEVREVALGLVGCQSFGAGYYTAYRHLAAEDLDFVLHTGDYLYESGFPNGARGEDLPDWMAGETLDLTRYHTQYGLYKADPDLRTAHATHPFVVYWDDHEVENNYASLIPQGDADAPTFARRRAEAYQAYYEHQPLRLAQRPHRGGLQLYRRLEWGRMLGLNVLDGRQHRSDQVPPDQVAAPDRTMLGARQERWVERSLQRSCTRWNLLGNQTVMSWVDNDTGPGVSQPNDNWNGYHAARDRLLGAVADMRARNVVVVTGDAHCSMAGDLRRKVEDFESSPVVGAEFLGTSISSGGDGEPLLPKGRTWLTSNPDMKFFDGRRGYVRLAMNRRELTTTYKALEYVTRPGAPIQTIAQLTVLDGVPGVQGGRITLV